MTFLSRIFKRPAIEDLVARKDTRGLARLLASGDIGDPLRAQAVAALVSLGKEAIPALTDAILDPERSGLAADALTKLGWEPGADEAGAMYWITQKQFSRCVAIGAPAVMPLLRVLWEGNADTQSLSDATTALADIGQPAIGSLLNMLPSKVAGDRAAACLSKMAPDVVLTPLLEYLMDADNRGIKTGLKNSIAALTAIGEPAVPALEAALAARQLDPATYRTIMSKIHPEA